MIDESYDSSAGQARRPLRAATAECADCHFVFEKPFMHAHFDIATPGRYEPGRTTTSRDKWGNIRGTSQSEGRYTSGTSKKVWLCENCHGLRVRRTRRNWLIGLGTIAAAATYIFALPDRSSSDATQVRPADVATSAALLDESQAAGNLDNAVTVGAKDRPTAADADANRFSSEPLNVPSEPTQPDDDVGGKMTVEQNLQNNSDSLVTAKLVEKVASKLARTERRKEVNWSIRVKGVKFRIAASEKTVSDISECRNLRFEIVDGLVGTFEPDQMWCKSDPKIGWIKHDVSP